MTVYSMHTRRPIVSTRCPSWCAGDDLDHEQGFHDSEYVGVPAHNGAQVIVHAEKSFDAADVSVYVELVDPAFPPSASGPVVLNSDAVAALARVLARLTT